MSQRYNEERVETALHRLALEAGNSVKTAEATGIPEQTLREWRNDTHRERYEAIRSALEERLDREIAEDMAALARQRITLLGEIGNELGRNLRTTEADLADAPDRSKAEERIERELSSLASADRNLATSLGILTQNNRALRDKPAQVIEHRYDLAQIEKAIRATENVIEGTAEELPPGTTEAAP